MINERNCYAYCCEDLALIENYNEAVNSPELWDCHHRLEIQDNLILSKTELKLAGKYYNQKASDLIFLSHSDHAKLHMAGKNNPFYGKHHSEETKHLISNTLKDRNLSEETKHKMSKAKTGEKHPMFGKHLSEEHKQKIKNYWDKRRQQKLFPDIQDDPE